MKKINRNYLLSNGSRLDYNTILQQQINKQIKQQIIKQKIIKQKQIIENILQKQKKIIQQKQNVQQQQQQNVQQQQSEIIKNKSNQLILTDLNKSKICIIYAYYERINEHKNQQNLSFFIKYGLDEKIWKKLDITYIFVINGYQCEVDIPYHNNIHVIKQYNCTDFEAWFNAIKYIENKNNNPIWKQFDYLCLLNASTNGPFMNENINSHWLYPFYNKMVQCNAVACSPYINLVNPVDPNPGPALSCHFTLIKINENIINLLLNTPVESVYPNSTCDLNKYPLYYNTVIGPKKSKNDSIFTGEYGLSRLFILSNYNICCLYYPQQFNIHTNFNIKTEREEFYHKNNDNLKNTIFIKNLWRVDETYVSLPILSDYCNDFIYNKLNQNSIYDNLHIKYNYNNLIIKKRNFIDNKSYYNIYGKSEQQILFPITFNNNIKCAIYSHYDPNNIIADYVIHGLKTLIYLGYDILFYTYCKTLDNIHLHTLPFTVNFIENNDFNNHWNLWLNGLQKIYNNENNKYEWIFLLNDTILFPIHGILSFQNTIIQMRQNVDFWGHWSSNEKNIHIICNSIEINIKLIKHVIDFILNNIHSDNIEYYFTEYLVNKGYKYNSVVNYQELNYPKNIQDNIFDLNIIDQWIHLPNTFAIKLKKMLSYLNENNSSKELNYLTRFLSYKNINNDE